MLNFVHPLPRNWRYGLQTQEVQDPLTIPADYHASHARVALPGEHWPSDVPNPVFAALASAEPGRTPAQAWESAVAFLYGCEWVAQALQRQFQHPMLYTDLTAYAEAYGAAPGSAIGWLFFAEREDQALTHLGDPALERVGSAEEVERQFRQYVAEGIQQLQVHTTLAPPWIRQMLLMRLGKVPWDAPRPDESQPAEQQAEQQAEPPAPEASQPAPAPAGPQVQETPPQTES